MGVFNLLSPFLGSLFGGGPAKLSGGNQPSGYGGAPSYANRSVTPETAMQLAAYWACVKLIGQTIGTLPLVLYELLPDGSRARALDNDLYDLLQNQPNADHTGVEFWEGVGSCLAVWGNAYALKTLRSDGTLIALNLLEPWRTTVRRDDRGSLVYRYTDPISAQEIIYTSSDLLHVRGFGFCNIVGLEPIYFARQVLGSASAADETAGRLFANGMKMTGWFRYKGGNGVLNAQQRIDTKQALIEPYVGSEHAGKVGILPGDFDWLPTNMNPADAELMNSRRMNVEEICRGFGVPPSLIGHAGEGQTVWGTGQTAIIQTFMTMGFRPLIHRIEAAIGRDILGRGGRRTLKAEFDLTELLRADPKTQSEIDVQDVNNGLRNRDQVRADRNQPPLPGGKGQSYTVNAALLPVEMLGKVAKLPKDKPVEPGADDSAPPRSEGVP